jgi:hypothetical protein
VQCQSMHFRQLAGWGSCEGADGTLLLTPA